MSVAVLEVRVDRPGINGVLSPDPVAHGFEIDADFNRDIRMIQHSLEHTGIAFLWHVLKLIAEVTVVAIGADRDARGHVAGKLAEIEPPLLFGVAPEEFVAQIAANGIQHDIFAGPDGLARFAHGFEIFGDARFIQMQAV
jgi:hypothetical protein